jgi:outer membrane receptor for ferrienterochelin and colicins
MVDKPAYLTLQSEERTHKIWMGSADYQINFNEGKSSFIVYSAFQATNRNHYTGTFPDDVLEIQEHIENPPYGISDNTTIQGGFQYNHEFSDFFNTKNVFTVGSEYISDKVFDNIPAYNYLVNQHTKNFGTFVQSDWDFAKNFNLLSGIRVDQHNFLDRLVFNPRVALLYKLKTNTQFRVSYGTGFRAPQAFDTDLHLSFAGGGVSRVQLSKDLKEETSESFSASVNYDKSTEKWIAGFTFEGFYTNLKDVFVNENIGEDENGKIFEKINGQGAAVKGLTLELRANFNKKIQLETGFTIQRSEFERAVTNIDGIAPTRNYLRTPNEYGFANLTFTPNSNWNINLNYVYTGPMEIAHFKGAENFQTDAVVNTKSFSELNSKIAYNFHVHKFETNFEVYGGVKNMANNFQNDFDKGKNRDSNYVYGPSMPLTYFIGLKISSN